MLREVWPFVDEKRRAGFDVVLARLIGRAGNGGRPIGAAMAVAADGDWTGSVSGGCVEGVLLDQAREVLSGSTARVAICRPGGDLMPWEPGPACSGELRVARGAPAPGVCAADLRGARQDLALDVRVAMTRPHPWSLDGADTRPAAGVEDEDFVERLRPRPLLVVVGATDLAAAVARLARPLGRRVVVVDPRPEFSTPSRVPAADEVAVEWPDVWMAVHALTADDAVLVVSHDARIDDRAVVAAFSTRAGHVAALGSRATAAERAARLAGTPGLDRLSAPAGLDLGGSSIAETALSLLAEAVAASHGRTGGALRDGTGPVQAS